MPVWGTACIEMCCCGCLGYHLPLPLITQQQELINAHAWLLPLQALIMLGRLSSYVRQAVEANRWEAQF